MKPKILVIDDEEDIALSIAEILQSENQYEVEITSDPLAAYQMVQKSEYDLLICDFNLPILNGDALYQRIGINLETQWNGKKPPKLLLMSGLLQEEFLQSKIQIFNGSAFLQKPFSATTLLSEVEKILTPQHQTAPRIP